MAKAKQKIQFLVDEKGRKKAVVLPIKEYEALLEDLADLALIAERKGEPSEPFDVVKKRLEEAWLIKGANKVAREIKARFSGGKIEPLEEVNLTEGEEITIIVKEASKAGTASEALNRSAGAWKGTLDFDAYLKDLYASRRRPSRDVSL